MPKTQLLEQSRCYVVPKEIEPPAPVTDPCVPCPPADVLKSKSTPGRNADAFVAIAANESEKRTIGFGRAIYQIDVSCTYRMPKERPLTHELLEHADTLFTATDVRGWNKDQIPRLRAFYTAQYDGLVLDAIDSLLVRLTGGAYRHVRAKLAPSPESTGEMRTGIAGPMCYTADSYTESWRPGTQPGPFKLYFFAYPAMGKDAFVQTLAGTLGLSTSTAKWIFDLLLSLNGL